VVISDAQIVLTWNGQPRPPAEATR
jgi:hypothetical protein